MTVEVILSVLHHEHIDGMSLLGCRRTSCVLQLYRYEVDLWQFRKTLYVSHEEYVRSLRSLMEM